MTFLKQKFSSSFFFILNLVVPQYVYQAIKPFFLKKANQTVRTKLKLMPSFIVVITLNSCILHHLHNNFQFHLQMNTQVITTLKGGISLDFDLVGRTAFFKNRNEQSFDVLWDICKHMDQIGAFRDISYIMSTFLIDLST